MIREPTQGTERLFEGVSALLKDATDTSAAEGLELGSPLALLPVFGNLLLIVAVILIGAWVLKKLLKPGMYGSKSIEIVATQNIGNRERLLVVNVGDQQLVVGTTPNSVNTLYVPESPLLQASDSHASFSSKLRESLAGDKS